jgi:DNA-directed RNA polymerase specialized sigma24 family protein
MARVDVVGRGVAPTNSLQPGRLLTTIGGMSDVTRILSQIESGDPSAAEKLLPLVYDELRKLAAVKLASEKAGQTLQATALVHEAYLRLVSNKEPITRSNEPVGTTDQAPTSRSLAPAFDSRGHFFAAAAQAMQRILVESARRKLRHRHGGQLRRVELPDEGIADTPRDEELLLLDEALSRLAAIRPQAATLVQLRFFGGQTVEEAAAITGISERTARRLWVFAQAWLRREIETLDDGKSLADK